METTKQVTREFLYRNDEVIERTIDQYQQWADEASNALNEAGKLLPKPLSKEQKEELLEKGWSALESMIRNEYGFPNGDVDTILKLQGLNGYAAKDALANVPNRYHAVGGFVITDNGLELAPDSVEKIKEGNTFFTKNEMQSEALKMAESLCGVLNDGFNKGLISYNERNVLINALPKLIQLTSARKEDQVFVPNTRKIAQMRA
ncbi:hypothetical protein [Flagellimonas sp. SN16]|uniref:hypothetical protein n=1 Tax=Flagellimonas sp. SN16 TaxID=3415142 RepID=UPI003C5F5481